MWSASVEFDAIDRNQRSSPLSQASRRYRPHTYRVAVVDRPQDDEVAGDDQLLTARDTPRRGSAQPVRSKSCFVLAATKRARASNFADDALEAAVLVDDAADDRHHARADDAAKQAVEQSHVRLLARASAWILMRPPPVPSPACK